MSDIDASLKSIVVASNVIFPKTAGAGVKVNTAAPDYPWHDIIGTFKHEEGGGHSPGLGAWRGGGTRVHFYAAGDLADIMFHIPHDYVLGTDIFLHLHWGHNGTAISGQLVVTYKITYAKGHNQEDFPAEITTTLTVSTPNIATIPQYRHRIDEIQISAATADSTHIDTDLLEPDGIIIVSVEATTIPTITGGSNNKPALMMADVHYQSQGIGTKNKVADFYT